MQKNRRVAAWLIFDVVWFVGWPILGAAMYADSTSALLGFFVTYSIFIGLRVAWSQHQARMDDR